MFNFKRAAMPLAAGLALVGAVSARASMPETIGRESSQLGHDEATFLADSITDNRGEIQLGKLAVLKGSTQAVREFGTRLVLDHTNALKKLDFVASTKLSYIPDSAAVSHPEVVRELSGLSGSDFDRAFLQHMVQMHSEDVDKFRKMSESAFNFDIQNVTKDLLPTLERHYELAKDLQSNPMGYYRPAGYAPVLNTDTTAAPAVTPSNTTPSSTGSSNDTNSNNNNSNTNTPNTNGNTNTPANPANPSGTNVNPGPNTSTDNSSSNSSDNNDGSAMDEDGIDSSVDPNSMNSEDANTNESSESEESTTNSESNTDNSSSSDVESN